MELLARCRDVALPFYIDLFHASLPLLRDHLFELGERSGNLRDQQRYLAAIQSLNGVFPAMQTVFSTALQEGFERFLAGQQPIPPKLSAIAPPQRGDLKLVCSDQLEDELAVATIVSRANSQQSEALWALNRRLALLGERETVSNDGNPFGPALVGYGLNRAMESVDCELNARLVMYKLLGKRFIGALGRLLDDLNELLRTEGVMPELRYEVRKRPASEATAIPANADRPTEAEPNRSGQQQLLRAIIDALWEQWRDPGSRSRSATGADYQGLETGSPGPQTFDAMDYARVLSALQRPLSIQVPVEPAAIAEVETQLFTELKQSASSAGRHQLAVDDATAIDFVGLLFRELLGDPNLPGQVTALLSYLHTPYLKLALLDPTVLEDASHPARQLLDRMAEIGGGWGVDAHDRVVMPRLRAMVDRILGEFGNDTALFAELLAELDQFMEGVERRAAMVARRSRDAQEGMERLHEARQCAAAAVAERLRGRQLPTNIERLLREPWTDFLAFNYLRGGEEGLAWRSALKVIDGVLWSVQGGGRDAGELARLQRQLEQSLAEGLRTIGYDSDAGERMLAALREAQELAAAGVPVVIETVVAEPAVDATPVPAALEPELQALVDELLARVEFDMLFEFRQADGPPRTLRVAWFSRVSHNYMFVNAAGVKQCTLALVELARGIQREEIRMLEQRPSFMARALGAMLRRLQRPASRANAAPDAQIEAVGR